MASFHQGTRLVPGAPRVPLPYFGVLVFFRNASAKPVTLERVRLVLRTRSPMRQIGTRWSLFAPEVCTRQTISCPLWWELGGLSTSTAVWSGASIPLARSARAYGVDSAELLRPLHESRPARSRVGREEQHGHLWPAECDRDPSTRPAPASAYLGPIWRRRQFSRRSGRLDWRTPWFAPERHDRSGHNPHLPPLDRPGMTAHVPRLPFSLHPLIAEAKRRARQRRVLFAAVVLVLALAAGGATLAVHPFGWLRTSQPYAGPYLPGGMFTGSGGIPPMVSWAGVQAVSAASRSDAWIVGSVARRWDGHGWRNVALPRISGSDLWSAAAVAPNDAWAVGWRSRGTSPYQALIEHWNGARWSVVDIPRLHSARLYGVSAAGPRSAWAVGATFRPRRKGRYQFALPLVLHWNGTSWRKQSLPWTQHGLQLDEVVATGPSSVWVISSRQDALQSRLEHWNGTRWRHVPRPLRLE